MSGPKSVRYISLEEIIAICEGLIARYRALSTVWLKHLETVGLGEENDKALVGKVLVDLERILEKRDTSMLQKRMIEEEAWLEREVERRTEQKADRRRREENSARRRVSSAATVLKALNRKKQSVPVSVINILSDARDGRDVDKGALNFAISAAFEALAESETRELTDAQLTLAKALGADTGRQILSDWLATDAGEDAAAGTKLDKAMADMTVMFGDTAMTPFRKRSLVIAQEPDPARRALLMDSFTIELATFSRSEKEMDRLQKEAAVTLAHLRMAKKVFHEEIERIETAIVKRNAATLKQLVQNADSAYQNHFAIMARAARRRALLDALNKLGYAVEEGMETAFAEEGRVVLERVSRSGYGVEVSGLVANDKFQVRATRFGDTLADDAADLYHEQEWCSSFSDLRTLLGGMGDELVLERAMGVGETPLKSVPRRRRDQVAQPRAKTVD